MTARKFDVGDKVRVSKPSKAVASYKGKVGYIVSYDERMYCVRFNNGYIEFQVFWGIELRMVGDE